MVKTIFKHIISLKMVNSSWEGPEILTFHQVTELPSIVKAVKLYRSGSKDSRTIQKICVLQKSQ